MDTLINLEQVSLAYELYHDRTNSLKETIINWASRRKYVEKKKEKFMALNSISFRVHPKERVGIIGRNGAGKSTLLKVLAGVLKPTSGDMQITSTVQPLIELGAGFDPEFTGRENIYLNSYMLGFTKKDVQAKEAEIISFSELEKFIDTPIKYYSSGMSLRLAFTIATSIKPEILIFDEILAAGDAGFIEKASARINKLIDEAKALIVVSHDLNFIQANCPRCLFLENGQIKFDGETAKAIALYKESLHTPSV